jgi:hypothetical protein
MFIFMKHDEGKISESILELSNAFNWHQRHSLQPWVKMMTMRKYFGSHFHSIVSYLPVIYRIFDTNTILTEQEERGFGNIRSISERTTNRKSRQIIENCIIRFNVILIFSRLMRQYLLVLPFLLSICSVY